jgi:hypothetical protein
MLVKEIFVLDKEYPSRQKANRINIEINETEMFLKIDIFIIIIDFFVTFHFRKNFERLRLSQFLYEYTL